VTYQVPDLPEKFEAFREALQWATGCEIFWMNQALEGRHREANRVWGELQIFEFSTIGVDENRYTEEAGNLQITQCGNRELTFQLNMKSRSQEHRDSAWYAASKAQMRINNHFVRDQWLKPNELSFTSAQMIKDTVGGMMWDDRTEDVAILEINMTTVLNDADASNIVSWIETIEASTGFKNPVGNDLDSSLQLDDEVMP
jgi:hypothetical protein